MHPRPPRRCMARLRCGEAAIVGATRPAASHLAVNTPAPATAHAGEAGDWAQGEVTRRRAWGRGRRCTLPRLGAASASPHFPRAPVRLGCIPRYWRPSLWGGPEEPHGTESEKADSARPHASRWELSRAGVRQTSAWGLRGLWELKTTGRDARHAPVRGACRGRHAERGPGPQRRRAIRMYVPQSETTSISRHCAPAAFHAGTASRMWSHITSTTSPGPPSARLLASGWASTQPW